MAFDIEVKRTYAPAEDKDGQRILVDRVWPRGVSKEEAMIDLWAKDLAPSTALRQWFGHDPDHWQEFRRRYHAELDANRDALAPLWKLLEKGRVTLVYAAKDERHNNAVALAEYLSGRRVAP